MEQKTLNIYEKLLAITSELSRVAKNLEVGFGQNKYKAVGEADVLAAVKPLEEKYKVYSFPYKREIVETGELETKTGNKNLFLRIATTYRFINVEKIDEFVDITSYGDGVDSQDKSVGKAMTYSDKYALMKAYKIITGDDPDQEMSQELGKSKTRKATKTELDARTKARQDFISFCKENGFDMVEVSKKYKLNTKSTAQDFLKVKADLQNWEQEVVEELEKENK